MRITDILSSAELIVPDMRAVDKQAAIAEVVACIARTRKDIDGSAALKVLVDRERLGSTGVGNGFAIPHGKLPNLTGMVAAFGRSEPGIEFGSLDGKPAHLFLMLLAPEGASSLHLKALARASRLFKDADFRQRLLLENTRLGLWDIISSQDARLAKSEEARE